jgi:hypothetical protein
VPPAPCLHMHFLQTAWLGPYMGVGLRNLSTWQPYQAVNFVTPPFSGYVSGHATFSGAAAQVRAIVNYSGYGIGLNQGLCLNHIILGHSYFWDTHCRCPAALASDQAAVAVLGPLRVAKQGMHASMLAASLLKGCINLNAQPATFQCFQLIFSGQS